MSGLSSLRAVALVAAAAAVLPACGTPAGAADLSDPVNVVEGYMKAVQDGKADGGQEFLEKNINDGIALTGSTSASRYIAANKGAKWQVVTVNYADPGSTTAKPTKKACLVIPPQGGMLCVVTVQVDATGKQPVWFHFSVESRYDPGWRIVNVDQVEGKPDNLLPTGNEAHIAG
jgi:hypothetical protein